MKKNRRGGLGRGLGALIQSTADTDSTQAPAASAVVTEAAEAEHASETSTPTPAQSATEKRRSGKAPASSTATSGSETKTSSGHDAAPSATKKTAGTAKNGTAKTSKATTSARGSRGSRTTGTKKSAATTTTTSPTAATTGASTSTTATKTTASKTTSTTTSPVGSKQTDAGPGTDSASETKAGGRPVDVFFSQPAPTTGDADGSARGDTSSATSAGTRRSTSARSSRPAMPTVKAPAARGTRSADAADNGRGTSPASAEPATSTAPPANDESGAEPSVSTDIAVLREISPEDIHPNPRQPREVFDEEHMEELVASIAEVGILQPVVVREVDGPTRYELIMGERRWRASQRAGLETLPAIVRQTPDENLLRDALLENLHRSQLNPLEEAAAYQQLMEDFECTQEELSARIGRSRPQISNTLRLMKLPPLVQSRVAQGALSAGHARALLGLTDPAEMERLAQRIVAEGLSVRATEEAVALAQGIRQAAPASRRRQQPVRHERLDYFANSLTSRLDTTVKITLGARKGKIAIDFTSVEDLNRIMDLIQGETGKD